MLRMHAPQLSEEESVQKKTDMLEIFSSATEVFDGEFTVDRDREDLVDVCLGLWVATIPDQSLSQKVKEMIELVTQKNVFPRKQFGGLIDRLEEMPHDRGNALRDLWSRIYGAGSMKQDARV